MLGPVLCLPEEEHKQPQLDTTVGRAWFHLEAGVPRTALAFTIRAAAQSGDLAGHTERVGYPPKLQETHPTPESLPFLISGPTEHSPLPGSGFTLTPWSYIQPLKIVSRKEVTPNVYSALVQIMRS